MQGTVSYIEKDHVVSFIEFTNEKVMVSLSTRQVFWFLNPSALSFLFTKMKENYSFNKINKSKGLYTKLLGLKSKNCYLSAKTVVNFYKTFLRSRIEYTSPAICSTDKSCFVKLEYLQLHVLLFVLNVHRGI